MPHVEPDRKLVISVLDRLIDREPRVSSESAEQAARRLGDLKAAIKRDLEWLLNTKRAAARPPESLGPAADSVLNYGLPDISNLSLGSPHDRDRLRRVLEEAVARFEPRLSGVRVTLEGSRDDERSLHFRIDATLDLEPEPEPITFDSVLQLQTKSFVVQGDQG
jgi:type VI secretion system protein ImpF